MNERIKELEDQCYEKVPLFTDGFDAVIGTVFNKEKFAELIVKECMLQCEPGTGLKYSPNSLSSRMDCREQIKQHFGVEE